MNTDENREARRAKGFLKNKKGSYIVESAISLPFLMLAMIVMTAILLMYACIEDSNFIMANELRLSAIEGRFTGSRPALPLTVGSKVKNAHSQVKSMGIRDYGFRVKREGIDELIVLTLEMKMKVDNPLNFKAEADYPLSLATRAYVGRERIIEPMDEDEFMGNSDAVFIFPKSGKHYHDKYCTYVKAAYVPISLTSSVRHKYGTCPICKSRKAALGSLVYVFPAYGKNYHLPGCGVMKRQCIEVSRKTAKKRGYIPCLKCGG